MCKHGNTKVIPIDGFPVAVDSCIAGIVEALNESGMRTVASCCGHGKRPGRISLADGREIFIVPDYETATKTDKFFNRIGFGPINPVRNFN